MKTLMVFLALLLGTALNSLAKDIATKDTTNKWYFWKTEGIGADTAYTYLTSKSYEGKSAQVFGNATENDQVSFYWRKNLEKSYLTPKYVTAMVSLQMVSPLDAWVEVFVGNNQDTTIYKVSSYGTNDYFLSHPEWFPQPYWAYTSYEVDTVTKKPDIINFVVIKLRYIPFVTGKNPKSEYIVDNLEFHYGKGNPYWDHTIDSTIVIDRFGDPDPTSEPLLAFRPIIDFGTIIPKATRDTSVFLWNIGCAPLEGVVSVIGSGFSLSDSADFIINPEGSVIKKVKFSPDKSGEFNGLLIVMSNNPASPDTVLLRGFGDLISTPVKNEAGLIKEFSLSQNYPNPFNPSTRIKYTVASMQDTRLTIYDVLGREVAVLVDEQKSAGEYEVIFNASNLPSGTYFCRLQSGNFTDVKRMILLK